MQSFAKVKSSQNGKITLSFTDIGKSCTSRESQTSLICILRLFAKIKISRIFPDFASKSGFLAATSHLSVQLALKTVLNLVSC